MSLTGEHSFRKNMKKEIDVKITLSGNIVILDDKEEFVVNDSSILGIIIYKYAAEKILMR